MPLLAAMPENHAAAFPLREAAAELEAGDITETKANGGMAELLITPEPDFDNREPGKSREHRILCIVVIKIRTAVLKTSPAGLLKAGRISLPHLR